jgi:two-component system OmpR family sensor kinase
MPWVFRRALFWRVYLTILGSLVLLAVFGAVLGQLVMEAPMGARLTMPIRPVTPALHMLGFLLAVAGAVGLAAYPVVSRITRRLEALRTSVETWGAPHTNLRAVVDGRDEIAAVATSFNAAAERVEALLAAHRTLLAHASHELRSPLARLALAAEMFAAAPTGELLGTINREIGDLDALVEEILLASRLDHGQDLDEREPVDCLALAAEEAARAGVEMRAVGAASPAFEVDGSARLLRRMIRNLIENAVKHGAPPVEVEVRHVAGDGGAALTIAVHDHGPGIPLPLRERVFEPFFRPDGRAEEAGSWGLGLSLVRQIARRHGGEVSCGASAEGVTTFVVELPADVRRDAT